MTLPSFTPRDWQNDPAGGTSIDQSDLDLRDQVLAALITYAGSLGDAVAALQATVGGTGLQVGTETVVPSTNRGAPSLGRRVYDSGLLEPIWGDGTGWRDATGTLLTGAGVANAPQNMTAVVNPDNSILMGWDPVVSATSYKLCEIQSPGGVAGATALTTTSTTRTPGSFRNYEYWTTATVGGVESASSNHVYPVLPYASTPSGSPAQLLAIGGVGGYWNLGVGYPTGHIDIGQSQLVGGFVDSPYFALNSGSTGVVFWTPMNGGRTSTNTKYPRTELRELKSDGVTKASWSGTSGHHRMQGKTKVTHYAPVKCEMVAAQIHDAVSDALQIHVDASSATGSQTWNLKINGSGVGSVASGVSLGQEVAWDIDLNNGSLTVKINGTTQYGPTNAGIASSGCYFKVGSYPQQNSQDQSNSPTDYASVELRDLVTTHT